jgi:hypothetical protein
MDPPPADPRRDQRAALERAARVLPASPAREVTVATATDMNRMVTLAALMDPPANQERAPAGSRARAPRVAAPRAERDHLALTDMDTAQLTVTLAPVASPARAPAESPERARVESQARDPQAKEERALQVETTDMDTVIMGMMSEGTSAHLQDKFLSIDSDLHASFLESLSVLLFGVGGWLFVTT